MIRNWHSLSIDEVTELLKTDINAGLSSYEAHKRLEIEGKNKLPDPPRTPAWRVLLNQFNDILIYILVIAAIVTLLLGILEDTGSPSIEYYFDSIVIVLVLLINAFIGFSQEIKAEKAVRSLQSMVSEECLVLRDGVIDTFRTELLVRGDIVIFQPGERIPADLRLVETKQVKINESALTGESVAAEKKADTTVDENKVISDQENMAFMGTIVETGRGKGVVVSTSIDTEIGKISQLVAGIEEFDTPLQHKLEGFSYTLAKLVVVISIFLIIFGSLVEILANPQEVNEIEIILNLTVVGVSLAVAAIPEGLPIILTFTLALSVQRLARKNTIIRKLQAIETLGTTTFIATDKTGTLTQNNLSLTAIITGSQRTEISKLDKSDINSTLTRVLSIMESVSKEIEQFDDIESVALDPLDKAIYRVIKQLHTRNIRRYQNAVTETEYPFDSERKMMSVVTSGDQITLNTKGAPDVILEKSQYYLDDSGEVRPLDNNVKSLLKDQLDKLANQGFRIIGCAYRELESTPDENFSAEDVEQQLVFVGFLTFIDPPRQEVYGALKSCISAGIKVAMITGDHPKTALTIAKELSLTVNDKVLTGIEIETMDDIELDQHLNDTRVFARVTPEHKLRLVKLLTAKGNIVAMTGDGVNDSPALVRADIGVSMGVSGTDAAKEASDMILMDDNFATLVTAIEEGRNVSQNIRKFTNYLLSSNGSEVLVLVLGFFLIAWFNASLLTELIPISESQILYLNLVTDSFLALALGLETKERGLMERPPEEPNRPIITKLEARRIAWIAILIGSWSIVIFMTLLGDPQNWEALSHERIAYVQSFTLTFLVITEVFIAMSYRSNQRIWEIGLTTNQFFFLSVIAVLLSHIAILYIPVLNNLFDTQPLTFLDWFVITIMGLIVFLILELTKSQKSERNQKGV